MDQCNGRLLQLSECIELLKSEVKKKMKHEAGRIGGTKVTEESFTGIIPARAMNFLPARVCAPDISLANHEPSG
jgi:hypothetical protein